MKKVRILTFHCAINYGAVLQAYALQKYIAKHLSVDVGIVDYQPDFLLKPYKSIPRNPINLYSKLKRKRQFDRFQKDFLNIIPIQFLDEPNQADVIYVVGSDQVWNFKILKDFDPIYFCSAMAKEAKRVAYAASMAAHPIPEKHKEIVTQSLKDFDSISVREPFALDQLRQLGIEEVSQVLDPVFLNDDYSEIEKEVKGCPKQYLLVYCLEYSKELQNIILKVALERDLKIVNVSPFRISGADLNVIGSGPREWVSLFRRASFVITNSFHGTSFATLFYKEFIVIPLVHNQQNFNRLIHLLETVGLEGNLWNGTNSNVKAVNRSEKYQTYQDQILVAQNFLGKAIVR